MRTHERAFLLTGQREALFHWHPYLKAAVAGLRIEARAIPFEQIGHLSGREPAGRQSLREHGLYCAGDRSDVTLVREDGPASAAEPGSGRTGP